MATYSGLRENPTSVALLSPPPFGSSMAVVEYHPNIKKWLWVVLIAAVFLAYQPTWRAGFIWDDDGHVTKPALRSLQGLGRIWYDLGATQQYYPLLHTVFWMEYRIFGDHPTGYHLVNLFLHALNSVLFGLLLRRLRLPGAYLAAGLFALHPVMVESVAWITELKNTLSGMCYLCAALAYLRFDAQRQKRWYGLALGWFVLALLIKTVTATLPGALLVVFWWQRGRLAWKRDVLPLVPFFVLGAASGGLTAWVEWQLIGAKGAEYAFTPIERGLIAGRAVWFYLGKLLWPAELIFSYPRWIVSQTVGGQYLYPVTAATALVGLWIIRRRWRGPLAAALFFLGTLFPVLGFFNVYPFRFSLVADHFQYLASLGVFAAVAAGLVQVAQRGSRWPETKPWFTGLGLTLLAGLGVLTWQQSRIYRDAETLYRATLDQNPQSWLAHNNLGLELEKTGWVSEAMIHYEQAIKIMPGDPELRTNLGNALFKTGRIDDAIAQYSAAIRTRPTLAEAHNGLGSSLIRAGKTTEGIESYRKAVQLKPDYEEAHFNLGNALYRAGQPKEAIVQYAAALRIRPGIAETNNNLGCALIQTGRASEAIKYCEEAVRLDSGFAEAHSNLAMALSQVGRRREAIAQYEETLRLKPDHVSARENLARLQAALPQVPTATK
jgi:tetratricopeptide (TPR) repeat protein